MRLIYSPDERRATLPVPRPASTGQSYAHVTRSHACTGVAFVGTSGPVTVEASADNWATTLYSADLTATGQYFAALPSPVAAASWRIRARGAATIGSLYPGVIAETLISPGAPFALERLILASDSRGIGGILVSEIKGAVTAGTLSFSVIPEDDIANVWRPLHEEMNGGRKAFVIENHISSAVHIVTSASEEFPFAITDGGLYWSGSFSVQGVP